MKNRKSLIIIVFILSTLFLSVGYATINTVTLTVTGRAEGLINGEVTIISAVKTSSLNTTAPDNATINGTEVSFNLSINPKSNSDLQKEYYAIYAITIDNDSVYDYTFKSNTFNSAVTVGNASNITITYSLDGIELNEIIPAKSQKTFTAIINLYPTKTGNYTISGQSDVNVDETDDGSIVASIPANSTGDLTGNNNLSGFTATVMNTYKEAKDFNFSIANDSFEIVDQNGNSLSTFNIGANATNTYNFYIRKKDGVRFPTSTQKLNVFFEVDGEEKTSMGVITLSVDADPTLTDDEPPTISGVVGNFKPEVGNVEVIWTGSDNVGIDHYTIEVYKKNGNSYSKVGNSHNTVADETSYLVTGLSDGTYYFKVYGTDTVGNTATSSEISSCSTSSGHCSRSTDTAYKWHFTVTFNLTDASSSKGNSVTVNYGENLTTTLSGTNGKGNPNRISSATMGNTSLSAGEGYTYNSSNGELTIYNITNNVSVTANGYSSCLVKGTKILLKDGKVKNVEDINYDDLLAVWNYDTGSITYEYPLWIENEHKDSKFTRITFSDDTYLDIAGIHALYDTDINLFITNEDEEHFKVGEHIAKIDNDGNFKVVSIKKIEEIKKEVTYYFVASTAYYNIIANNILTTDRNLIISNLYGFTDKAKWPSIKQELLNDKNNLIDYSYFDGLLPYYLYKGFRVNELGYLANYLNVDKLEFKYWIKDILLSPHMIKHPKEMNGKRMWMVTLSTDIVTDYNKYKYLKYEGSIYTLPSIPKVKYWYSTSENKYYKPLDKVTVYHGMHFQAIYN